MQPCCIGGKECCPVTLGAVRGKKNDIAWQAVEYNGTVHNQLQKLKRVAAQMYKYHFSKYLGRKIGFKSKLMLPKPG